MIPDNLRKALREFKEGAIGEEQILDLLRDLPYQNLDFAKVDHHRALRHGFPEVIFGKGKTADQIEGIGVALLAKHPNLLVTRATEEAHERLKNRFPECRYYPNCGALTVVREFKNHGRGKIGIFSAGTADIPVAEEAQVTAEAMGNETHCCYDVGVAGLHRILSQLDTLRSCTVVIVAAGMEGALPSVVGGLVDLPVIAVPTSIGYGASFNGIAALLGMLNSCSANVSVVNIDNGFGAGYIASLINRKQD
ncbi:MAG: nickel pincer cofactor biosynthesis protein LarB [Acidobacteria bacterium]|nr:MAG: nickel pincer cofactor biosynthesis protein LarB [Acidobacteriota bacterium]